MIGTEFENVLHSLLLKNNCWAYRCPTSITGQPADLIVVRPDGKAILIECKNIKGDYFQKSRIEDNQSMQLDLFQKITNQPSYFAFYVEKINKIVLVSSTYVLNYDKENIHINKLVENGNDLHDII